MTEEPLKDYAAALYDRLRALARARMLGQRVGHTLDPTGLANEAIVRLLKCEPDRVRDEDHFMALAAEAMRQILVDHARAKATEKRGRGTKSQSLDDVGRVQALELQMDPLELLALNEALSDFEKQEPEAAAIVKMRVFVGMDSEEIAALHNVSRRTVERRLRYAMAELRVRMSDSSGAGDGQGRQVE